MCWDEIDKRNFRKSSGNAFYVFEIDTILLQLRPDNDFKHCPEQLVTLNYSFYNTPGTVAIKCVNYHIYAQSFFFKVQLFNNRAW